MNQEELKTLVAQMLRELEQKAAPGTHKAPSDAPPEPPVKASEYKPTAPVAAVPENPDAGGASLPDITQTDLRQQYLVERPANPEAFLALKRKTPARIGIGRAGTRYKTATLLRFRADHAAAQDSVFSLVDETFYKNNDLVFVQTKCRSKDEYLTRPDLGRRFDDKNAAVIRQTLGRQPRIALVIGDGLSSKAVEANALDCAAAIRQGLKAQGVDPGKTLFIQYCRVGASDHIGSLTDAELVCMLVGERPGLVTSESMSAYLTYAPRIGVPESARTVVSNIHRQGTPAVEAGAHIAGLIQTILSRKASGVNLRQVQT